MIIDPKPGTYVLILSCASNARIQVGRLGMMQLQRGYYVYLGSALGPGGLRARIAHHQKPSTRPHWHIDYLRAHTRLRSVWLNYDGKDLTYGEFLQREAQFAGGLGNGVGH